MGLVQEHTHGFTYMWYTRLYHLLDEVASVVHTYYTALGISS